MQLEKIPDGTVVVGVDGSASSRHALHWATDQAVLEGRALTLLHAVGTTESIWTDQDGRDTRVGVDDSRTHHALARGILDTEVAEVRRRAPAVTLHQVLRFSDARDEIVAASKHAAMVVVGSRGRGPVRSRVLGSVGVAVVRHASCPAVVVRPSTPGLVRHGVLAGADATERSIAVLDLAYRMASTRRLPLTVMHTFVERHGSVSNPPRGRVDVAEAPTLHRIDLAESMSGMAERYPDVHVTTMLARGLPTECLVREAARMDLVVVGSPAWGAVGDILFGSVAASVVERVPCPVAVVPVGQHA